MYQALIAACSCKTTFRHAKAVTVLIVGTAFHSLSLGSGSSWIAGGLVNYQCACDRREFSSV